MAKWLRTWVKKGRWSVYEGDYGMAIGENGKYAVFAVKDNFSGTNKITYNANGFYANKDNGYKGVFSKAVAENMINRADDKVSKGGLLHKWLKFNDRLDIYYSDISVSFGNDRIGYLVYGNKSKLKIWAENGEFRVKSGPESQFVGKFKSRLSAVAAMKKIENAFYKEKVVFIETDRGGVLDDDTFEESHVWHSRGDEHKGAVIVVPKGDNLVKEHELGHVKAGHHLQGRHATYTRELEANEHAIKNLKRKGQYTKVARDRMATYLAGYSKIPYQKKRRALRDISKIEQGLGII